MPRLTNAEKPISYHESSKDDARRFPISCPFLRSTQLESITEMGQSGDLSGERRF
jgi:hypothetical protein